MTRNLELIRFLQVAQTITVHHGALAYLLGINALRASEAAAVRIEDYADTLRGHRVLHLVGKGNKPATMPLTVPVLRVLGLPWGTDPGSSRGGRSASRTAAAARHAAITNALDAGVPCATPRSWPGTPTPEPPNTTTAPAATSTATASTS
jgi:integrase/recombinase XerD